MIKTIIALGNGLEYSNTPHNRGEDFIRWYLKENNILLKQEKLYDYAVIENGNTVVIPKTFMNQSGKVLPMLKNKNLFNLVITYMCFNNNFKASAINCNRPL